MRGSSPSLLFAAIWLASTALALVARNSNHQARAETTPEYPKGYDAKSCHLDRKTITFHITPAGSEAITQHAAALSRASMSSSVTQRDLTPEELSQVCRQVGRFPFEPGQYSRGFLDVETSTMQPGLYVVSITATMLLRRLYVGDVDWLSDMYLLVNNNQVNHIGGQFQIHAPVRLRIVLTAWWSNPAGEIALFRLGPRGYAGPSS